MARLVTPVTHCFFTSARCTPSTVTTHRMAPPCWCGNAALRLWIITPLEEVASCVGGTAKEQAAKVGSLLHHFSLLARNTAEAWLAWLWGFLVRPLEVRATLFLILAASIELASSICAFFLHSECHGGLATVAWRTKCRRRRCLLRRLVCPLEITALLSPWLRTLEEDPAGVRTLLHDGIPNAGDTAAARRALRLPSLPRLLSCTAHTNRRHGPRHGVREHALPHESAWHGCASWRMMSHGLC
mmetsp:Transcript_6440/g.11657  ORF Transcript_6440/g.11657 Transcript_6440/m.11657 type:complete len:243 (-) Transcript_6440:552-1280(-)